MFGLLGRDRVAVIFELGFDSYSKVFPLVLPLIKMKTELMCHSCSVERYMKAMSDRMHI